MKLNKEQIKQIRKLRKEGESTRELAKQFNISQGTIVYHTNEGYNKKSRETSKKRFQKLSPKQKKERNIAQSEYRKKYFSNRYKTDPEFRKRMIEYQRKYQERKRKKNIGQDPKGGRLDV